MFYWCLSGANGNSVLAWGQAVNGSMVGTVTDSSGGVVPSAKITILEVNTGSNRSANTNESGNYTFSDLPPGTYRGRLKPKDSSVKYGRA